MSGHLSKDPNIDLYVFNRSNRVTKRWLKDFNGFELKLSKDNKNKFNGLITCLKDDSSIVEVLIKNNFIGLLKSNAFVIDHSTTSLQLIQNISSNKKFISGYTGWSKGQLENEIKNGDWIVQKARDDLIFETDCEKIWNNAMKSLGFNYDDLSINGGSA